jgi:hypothetical protein
LCPTLSLSVPLQKHSQTTTLVGTVNLPLKRKLDQTVQSSEPDAQSSDIAWAPYAQYGVISRQLPFRKPGEKSCIVLSKGRPSWFWAAKSRNYEIKIVLLGEVQWKPLIKRVSPSTEVFSWKEIDFITWPGVDAVFSDYALRGKLTPLWTYITKHVVSSKAMHTPQPNWGYTKTQLLHAECGGVTDGRWWVHIYSSGLPLHLSFPKQGQRDVSTILDAMVNKGHPCTAPKSIPACPIPRVVEICPGTYHSSGLVPWKTRSLWVITPNGFSPTKWCRRKLTQTEILLSRDVPSMARSMLSEDQVMELLLDSSYIPNKCCLALLDAFPSTVQPSWVPTPVLGVLPNDTTAELGVENQMIMEAEHKLLQGATKADDAAIPMQLWDERILPALPQQQRSKILVPIRNLALRWWRRSVLRDFLRWFKAEHKKLHKAGSIQVQLILRNGSAKLDWEAGRDCIRRCAEASWWEWDAGSRPLHWRWPKEYRIIIRDGLPPWFITKPPETKIPQCGEPDVDVRHKIKEKLYI